MYNTHTLTMAKQSTHIAKNFMIDSGKVFCIILPIFEPPYDVL